MTTLSFAQIEDLWQRNGGNPNAAPIMAAIALAESGGRTDAANTKPPDASYGLFQINYYGALGPSRTAQYGSPAELIADPNRQARAAIAISGNGSNLRPWSTFTSGAYKQFLNGALPAIPGLPSLGTAGGTDVATPAGQTYDEGKITMPSILPDIPRALLRRIAGGAVMTSAAIIGLAGVFVLAGRKVALPGPAAAVQKLAGAGVERRARRAEESIAATTPDELAERRRNRDRDRRERDMVERSKAAEPF